MSRHPHNILYIDDEENNLIVFKNAFFRYYNIYTALSGEQGLKVMDEQEIHLIITDQRMPGMTGIEVLEEVVKTNPETIRMVLTAYSDIEIIIRAINKCGIYQYILKPWDSRELKLVIDNALNAYDLSKKNKLLLRDLQRANQELEEKVKKRTEELNKKNRELSEINQVKDRLFSIISHDLRAPMSSLSVLLNVFMNLKDNVSEEKIGEYSLKVQSYIKDVTNLLDNLLNWSLTQLGDREMKLESLDVKPVIEENLDFLMFSAEQKNIGFRKEFENAQVKVLGDREMLNLVLRNLLNNAIKYTEPGGKVKVSTQKQDKMAEISVEDTGVGMTETEVSSLFSEGQFISRRGTDEEKGAGLGLKLCKEFVEKQGGMIYVESKPGKGSRFGFTVPLHS